MSANYTDVNSAVVDKWVNDNWEQGIPISHENYVKALNGEWHKLHI